MRAAKLQLFLADLLRRAIDLYARKEEKIRSRRLFDAFRFDDETRGVFEQVAETLKGLAAARGDPRYTCAFNLTEQERDPKYMSPEECARMMRTWQTVQGRVPPPPNGPTHTPGPGDLNASDQDGNSALYVAGSAGHDSRG